MKKYILYAVIVLAVAGAGIFVVVKNIDDKPANIENNVVKPSQEIEKQTEENNIEEKDLGQCQIDDDCVIVKYNHCCGTTKKAINKKYLEEYNKRPEWQGFNNEYVCARIGVCLNDAKYNEAYCDIGLCSLRIKEDAVLYEQKSSWGPCANPEGGCFLNTYVYTSGKIVLESKTIEEKQISKDEVSAIIKEIKNSGVMEKECDYAPVADLAKYYTINLDGKIKKIIFPGCEDELKIIDDYIDSFIENNKIDTSQEFICKPKFLVDSGPEFPELTASQAYSQVCYSKQSKEECEKVDIYRASTNNFGNSDGIYDCDWVVK